MLTRDRTHRAAYGLLLALIIIFGASCSLLQGGSSGTNTAVPPLNGEPGTPSEKALQGSTAADQITPWFEGGCADAQIPFPANLEIQPVPSLEEPAPRKPYIDPVFGTCVVRVTDRSSDLAAGEPSRGMKNEYSRVQSFNADGSRLIAFTTEGNWYLYDAASLQPLGELPIWHEPRWDYKDPELLYYTEETRLMSYRISNGRQQVMHEFASDFPGQDLSAVWTKYEGSPSADNRYWGLMAEDQDWMTVALLIYDLETDQIVALRETSPSEIDSVTISPLSNYFLAYYDNYCEPGWLGSDESPCGLMVYDKNLENGRGLLRIVGHSDPALDVHSKEVLVYQDIDTDHISMLDLSSGAITPLLPIDFSHSNLGFHFSGRSFRTPGWILVSTSNGSQPSSTWMDDQIFAAELEMDGRIVRLAHTHSSHDEKIEHDYWAEPHASVNQDFTQVVFTSNWGLAGTDQVDMYMINLPANWVSHIP
jgi:hypothetical protein